VISVDPDRHAAMAAIPIAPAAGELRGPPDRAGLRTQARYRELTKALTSGVLVGEWFLSRAGTAPSPVLRPVVVQRQRLEDYRTSKPGHYAGTLAQCWEPRRPRTTLCRRSSPALMFLASVARPPARNFRGIRALSHPAFSSDARVRRGPEYVVLAASWTVADLSRRASVPYDNPSRHAFICGAKNRGSRYVPDLPQPASRRSPLRPGLCPCSWSSPPRPITPGWRTLGPAAGFLTLLPDLDSRPPRSTT